MSQEQYVRPVAERESLKGLDQHKAEFFANGGKITHLPYGAMAVDPMKAGKIQLTLTQASKLGKVFKEPKKEGWHQK